MIGILRGNAAPRLIAADAVAKLARGEIAVPDLREANEVAASGTDQGGMHIPLSMVPLKANPQGPDFDPRIDPKKPVAVFCAVGAHAGMAAQTLLRLGYEATSIGGFSDWAAAGGPVKR